MNHLHYLISKTINQYGKFATKSTYSKVDIESSTQGCFEEFLDNRSPFGKSLRFSTEYGFTYENPRVFNRLSPYRICKVPLLEGVF